MEDIRCGFIGNLICLKSLSVEGFVQVTSQGRNEAVDYAFVVSVVWSSGQKRYIKRTYHDFLGLQCFLMTKFGADLKMLKVHLPVLPGRSIFRKNNATLAEDREVLLNNYVQNLLEILPNEIRLSPSFLQFFQTRRTDPQPLAAEPVSVGEAEGDSDELATESGEETVAGGDDYFFDMDFSQIMLSEDNGYCSGLSETNSPSGQPPDDVQLLSLSTAATGSFTGDSFSNVLRRYGSEPALLMHPARSMSSLCESDFGVAELEEPDECRQPDSGQLDGGLPDATGGGRRRPARAAVARHRRRRARMAARSYLTLAQQPARPPADDPFSDQPPAAARSAVARDFARFNRLCSVDEVLEA